MEALGRLAGGIAHDFNNILGSILGFAGLIRQDLPESSPDRRFSERILAACERGKGLIDQIAHSRLPALRSGTSSTWPMSCDRTKAFSRSLCRRPRASTFSRSKPVLTVLGSEALIGQAIVNLCINASEALNGKDGDLTVTVGPADEGEIARLAAGPLGPGERLLGTVDRQRDYVVIKVSDNAGGISDSVLDRMFEPFFTTKGRERGTGLGLAVVRGVVESHNGACRVKTRLGVGTEFSVYLLLHPGVVKRAPVAIAGEKELRGKERILIVDDEPDLVDALAVGLTRLGYEVVSATDPREALEAFEEDPGAWDVVITDEVMPFLRGTELLRRMKAVRPHIATVLCTGYSENDDGASAECVDIFLLKPVDAATIAQRLRNFMDTAAVTEPVAVP
jgi:CheY-like chemotaxis protein